MTNLAQHMNTLSALYALPTFRGLEELEVDVLETTDFLANMKERGETLPCVRLIEYLMRITDQQADDLFDVLVDSPEVASMFVDEFIADFIDINEEDMEE